MKINSIHDEAFKKYGRVITDYDFSDYLKMLEEDTPDPDTPADSMIYVASSETFEKLPVSNELRDHEYGGVPIEVGYCCGKVDHLNALEFHCNSEIVITGNDQVILVGAMQDIVDYKYDSAKLEAFFVPKGTCWELYATTLHYAPFTMKANEIFKHVVVLIYGTNFEAPEFKHFTKKDEMMAAKNSWKLCCEDSPEAAGGGYVGIVGKNIDRKDVFGD